MIWGIGINVVPGKGDGGSPIGGGVQGTHGGDDGGRIGSAGGGSGNGMSGISNSSSGEEEHTRADILGQRETGLDPHDGDGALPCFACLVYG